MYVGQDWVSQAENLLSAQATENKDVEEVM
jgi:hypothetical protein